MLERFNVKNKNLKSVSIALITESNIYSSLNNNVKQLKNMKKSIIDSNVLHIMKVEKIKENLIMMN